MKNLANVILIVAVFSMCSTDRPKNSNKFIIPLPEAGDGITFSSSSVWDGEAMFWNTRDAGRSLYFKIPKGNIEKYDYLICELYHKEVYSLRVGFNFFDDKAGGGDVEWQSGDKLSGADLQPRIGVKIGATPGLETNVVFPLSHLDGQEIFLRRFPRQMKGTVSGHRIAKENVVAFSISIDPFDSPRFEPEVQIKSIYLSNQLPEPLDKPTQPVVDEFGQWSNREFKGKIKSEDELREHLTVLENIAKESEFPDNWSQYGGWKEKQFQATGFFQVIQDNDKWWMADPEGYAFVSVGVDCMRPSASGWIEGQRDIFSWLPEPNDPQYGECYGNRRGEAMFDFFKSNLIRVYGDSWESKWQEITVGLMKAYGINTIGNWSDFEFIKMAKMPYVYPLANFPSTNTALYRDFPDVYSYEYQEKSKEFAGQLKPLKDDPFMIGYFLRNEPNWAFGKNNIAFEMFAEPKISASKNAFLEWIARKYDDIESFNESWKLDLSSFEELEKQTFLDVPSETAEADFWDFSKILVRKYVDVVCDEVEKVDPNHLNLGMRYAWISSDLLYEAGERFDVFSINGYRVPYPPETSGIYEKSGKPVMIGEFHFGSIDRGLPSTGITGVASQEERGKAYRNYIEHGLSRNELIGIHYFQWLDQPIFGRFDGENYNIGLLTIAHTPYEELVEAMKESNLKIYEIITGGISVYNEDVDIIPSIYF
jgi:hypothetical protein